MATKNKKNVSKQQPMQTKSAKRRLRANKKARWGLEIGETSIPGLGTTAGMRITDRTVGLAEYASQQQVKMPRIVSRDGGRLGSIDELKGSEFLGSISSGDIAPQAGDLLARILINPSTFDNTRIQQFARLYQRYRFKRAAIRYQADANSTQSGSIIGYMDYDVDNLVTNDDPVNVKRAAAHFAQEPSKIWQSREFFLGIVDRFTTLFTDSAAGNEDRLVYQGVFYLIAATELPPFSALGTLYLDYECEFSIPAIEGTLVNESLTLSLLGVGTPTVGNPFGDGAIPYHQPGRPDTNIIWQETAGQLLLKEIPAGNYQVLSSLAAVGLNLNGANLMRISVEVTSENALWADSGLSLKTFTTYNVGNNAGSEDGSFTGTFNGILQLETYVEDLVLDVTLGIPGNGLTFTDDSFVFTLFKLPDVFVSGAASKLLQGKVTKKDTCLVMKPQNKKPKPSVGSRLLGSSLNYQRPEPSARVRALRKEDSVVSIDSASHPAVQVGGELDASFLRSKIQALESEVCALKRACHTSELGC